MRYKLLIILLFFSCVVFSSCFKNGYLETINYWYYHVEGARKCMEKLTIKPSESICNIEENRKFHFVKQNNPEADWFYYYYEDKIKDNLLFKDSVLITNNAEIKGKKTTRNLTESKAIEFCDKPPINIDEKLCTPVDLDLTFKKQITIAVITYVFSGYNKKDLFYKEIQIDSEIADLATDIHRLKIKKKKQSISYRFIKFRRCGDYFKVNLISYSAPKASSEKVFILKINNKVFEIIKEKLLWIS